MSRYFIMKGNEIIPTDHIEWAAWFEGADRQIGSTTIGESYVSTVFLGLDHSFGCGPPMIFETMVFDGPLDGDMDRYSTLEDAKAGHNAMCTRVCAAQIDAEFEAARDQYNRTAIRILKPKEC